MKKNFGGINERQYQLYTVLLFRGNHVVVDSTKELVPNVFTGISMACSASTLRDSEPN